MVKGRATLYEEVSGTYSDSESSVSETAGTTLSVGNRAGLTAVRPLWITSITYLRNNPELDTPAAIAGSHRLITRIQPQPDTMCAGTCRLIGGRGRGGSPALCIMGNRWVTDKHPIERNILSNKIVNLMTLKMSSGGISKWNLTFFSLHLEYMQV